MGLPLALEVKPKIELVEDTLGEGRVDPVRESEGEEDSVARRVGVACWLFENVTWVLALASDAVGHEVLDRVVRPFEMVCVTEALEVNTLERVGVDEPLVLGDLDPVAVMLGEKVCVEQLELVDSAVKLATAVNEKDRVVVALSVATPPPRDGVRLPL